jgi:anti-sigma factor RsiW
MKHDVGTPMTFGARMIDELLPLNSSEELDWLMSLALDGELNADEAARLEALLRQEPGNAERWAAWQVLDSNLHQMPHALPPADFGEKFALRLEIQERRRRLRTGAIFGIAAVALWGSVLVGVGLLGAFMWANQADWLAGIVHNLAYWWVAMRQFGQALLNTVEALWSAPQTRALVVCYIVLSVAILAGWFAFLRRTTRELPLGDAQLVEA